MQYTYACKLKREQGNGPDEPTNVTLLNAEQKNVFDFQRKAVVNWTEGIYSFESKTRHDTRRFVNSEILFSVHPDV